MGRWPVPFDLRPLMCRGKYPIYRVGRGLTSGVAFPTKLGPLLRPSVAYSGLTPAALNTLARVFISP